MATQFERMNISGKAQWAKVLEPDTKFNADGEYSVDVLIPEADAQPICEKLDGVVAAEFARAVKEKPALKNQLSQSNPYQIVYDDNTGDPTGDIKFKAKMKAVWRARDGRSGTQRPIVVDAKRQPLSKDIAIGNGSTVNVNVELVPYIMQSTKSVGCSLRLKGLQVVNLVEYASGGSMFDTVEGGYVSAENQAIEEAFAAEELTDAENQGDF